MYNRIVIVKKINILCTSHKPFQSYRHCKEKQKAKCQLLGHTMFPMKLACQAKTQCCDKRTLFQHPGTGKPSSPWNMQSKKETILEATMDSILNHFTII